MSEPYKQTPQPPKHIGKYGFDEWKIVGKRLVAERKLDESNLQILELYCEAYNDYRQSIDDIGIAGATCVSEKGGVYQHPAVSRKQAAIKRMAEFGKMLGWTEIDPEASEPEKRVSSRPKGL